MFTLLFIQLLYKRNKEIIIIRFSIIIWLVFLPGSEIIKWYIPFLVFAVMSLQVSSSSKFVIFFCIILHCLADCCDIIMYMYISFYNLFLCNYNIIQLLWVYVYNQKEKVDVVGIFRIIIIFFFFCINIIEIAIYFHYDLLAMLYNVFFFLPANPFSIVVVVSYRNEQSTADNDTLCSQRNFLSVCLIVACIYIAQVV